MLERLLIALFVMAIGVGLYLLFQRRQQARATAAFEPTGKPTVLYFRSDACAPCATQARFLDMVRGQFGDLIAIEKIDADVDRERAERFGVFTLPTTLIIDAAGKVRHANYGLAEPVKLAAQLREV
jgi:thiol-disulfide isomerase/thioredoxin